MTAFAAREYHRFEAAGKPFVYLVPSAAVFALDDVGDAILSAVTERPHSRDELSVTFGANFGVDRVLGHARCARQRPRDRRGGEARSRPPGKCSR